MSELAEMIKKLREKTGSRIVAEMRCAEAADHMQAMLVKIADLSNQLDWVRDQTALLGYDGPMYPTCSPLGIWLEELVSLRVRFEEIEKQATPEQKG